MRNILIILGVLAVLAIAGVAAYERFGRPPAPPIVAAPTGPSSPGPAAGRPQSQAPAGQTRFDMQVRPTDKALGRPDAKVTIVEYASLTCPHCATFHNATLPQLKRDYIDPGHVRLVYRDFPLDGLALRAAMLPHCAGDERYFPMLDLLFARQSQWAVNNPNALGLLANVAAQAGMGQSEFEACLANEAVQKKVLDSALEGERSFQVRSTPTLFVNGVPHAGAVPYEALRGIVDPLLK